MNTEEKLKKYQNELEQVKSIKLDLPGVSTETSTTSSSANEDENEEEDELKKEIVRIVQEEILRVSTESNELVEDDPNTSDEQPVNTNLTTYTSYEIDPSIVHDISSEDGGCFGWLCCAGGEENLDKSSWYDASSISSGSEGVEHEANDGLLGIRAV